MACTITATAGSSTANSYATIAEGTTYHETHLYATAWEDASDDERCRALQMATRLLDQGYEWLGSVTDGDQSLLWPRSGVTDVDGFLIALLIFTVTGVLIEPLLRQTAVRSAPALLGSTALIPTLISLVVTALVSNGLQISGFTTWILATILVWLIALAARFLLPFIIFRRTFEELRERRRD